MLDESLEGKELIYELAESRKETLHWAKRFDQQHQLILDQESKIKELEAKNEKLKEKLLELINVELVLNKFPVRTPLGRYLMQDTKDSEEPVNWYFVHNSKEVYAGVSQDKFSAKIDIRNHYRNMIKRIIS